MCGIVGYAGTPQSLSLIVDGLRQLEYRGYDSSGLAFAATGEIHTFKAAGKLGNLLAGLPAPLPQTTCAVGHTRWATHGAATNANAHPHAGPQGRVVLVHNGIIENHATLPVPPGAAFASQTDSERLAHWIELATADASDFAAALNPALHKATGAYALAILARDHPGRLFAARRYVPLLIGILPGADGSDRYVVASDASALPVATRFVVHLRDGEIATLAPGRLAIIDADGRSVTPTVESVVAGDGPPDRGAHPHFMLKEIHEQPTVVRRTLAAWQVPPALAAALAAARRIVIVGCGTSLNAGLVGRDLIERWSGLPVTVEAASEFRYRQPVLQPHDLLIAISQSGETADTLAALRLARGAGLTTLALTNRPGSSLAREAQLTLPLQAGIEISVAATKSFTAQVLALTLLALELCHERRITTPETTAVRAALPGLALQLDTLLADTAAIAPAVALITPARSTLFIGRGTVAPVALEAALKLKEISYIHAEGAPAGELKHGPLALLDESLPVVALLAAGPVRDKTLSNCQEAQARGAPLIGIADHALPADAARLFTALIRVPAGPEALAPITLAVATQLLAYQVALALGRDIDQPRNIAKSVTVE